jgi:hypothetical protein
MVPPTVEPLERIQQWDVRRPERAPSLPAWLASLSAALKPAFQPDPQTGKYRSVPTLPASMTLSNDQRDEIAIHIMELRQLCRQTPLEDPEAEQAVLRALSAMFVTVSSQTQNDIGAEARGELYLVTLEDIPLWAATAAIRRWCRGDCADLAAAGQPFNFPFCPSPANLRRVAYHEMMRVEGRADQLQELLDAESRLEFSDDHRANMQKKLSQIKVLGTPLVGKDGSGGAAGDKPAEGAHCGTRPEAQPGLKREGGRRRRGDRRK